MDQNELNTMLMKHQIWLNTGGKDGQRLVLRDKEFSDLTFYDRLSSNFTRLAYADLSYSTFRNCNFSYVLLYKAELAYVNFNSCLMDHCEFTGASIRLMDLKYCRTDSLSGMMVIGPIGSRWDMLYAVKHFDNEYVPFLMFKTGCFYGTEREFRKAIRERHKDINPEIVKSYYGAIAAAKYPLLNQRYKPDYYIEMDSQFSNARDEG